jgi:DNA-binding response OmpR family regulator
MQRKDAAMGKRVLLVEDSRTQAIRMQLELQQHGLEVEIATDGQRGLEAARSQENPPDVVVLDVDLPGIDGYGVCRALKDDAATEHIPIVMLTHYDDAKNTLEGLQIGAIDYIPKDAFAEQNLLESLKQLGVL